MPLATTQKSKEMERISELLVAISSENPPSSQELEEISDRAIDCILNQAYMDPENMRILRVLPTRKRSNLTRLH